MQYVPDLIIAVPGIEYLSYGNRSIECEVRLTVDVGRSEITVTSRTASGSTLCEHRLDETESHTLADAAGQEAEPTGVLGLTRAFTWDLSGATVGSEVALNVTGLSDLSDWLRYALGEQQWDTDRDGSEWDGR